MTTDEYEGEFTEADVRAWREGDWHFITLAGELIHKRFTRDRAFTHALVAFQSNRSPRYPRTRRYLDMSRTDLTGGWRRVSLGLGNSLLVPIEQPTP